VTAVEYVICDWCGEAAEQRGATLGALPSGWEYNDLADLCPRCAGGEQK